MNATTTLVTLTYGDRIDYLKALISRSLGSPHIARVIVVSNASRSNLHSLHSQWPGQVELVELPANTGSAHGYKVGIQAALDRGAEHIWLMDDDNAPTLGAIEALHQRLAESQAEVGQENAAVIGFRPTHQADIAAGVPRAFAVQWRSSCFGFHIAQLPYKVWRRLPFGRPRPKAHPVPLVKLPFTTYGGLLAHASLFRKIGLPLSALVLYADDTEYTRRITAKGGCITLVTGALLDDLEASWNIKARSNNIYEAFLLGNSDLRAYYTARNQAWFDKYVWAGPAWLYRLNRALFLFLLRQVARRKGTGHRLALIEQAIRDGEAGRLGMHEAFPL
ncbi:glycosyltransferase [Pseudomonas typographi]|uniref:Glycosyltransferase n=1 Tax=Pseudomonas typographi TaxID=2715964 RepID=A0ABR7YVH9_9PSED|nr:glycosyltransferase [Pseudomonas typographi]MBD1552156.1 glycosyltransferase [Pseudomonas typographi]MBD1585128.1 glycosyltransferase [Pseudomonas typographi]MBD1597175.1 glycosyltransferase [Pseudomonas typographi]